MPQKSWLTKFALFIVSIIFLGFTISLFCSDTTKLTFDVDVLSVISLALTTGLGIYVALILEKRKTETRFEKDYIIEKIKEIEPNVLLFVKEVRERKQINYSKASKFFKMARMQNQLCIELISAAKLPVDCTCETDNLNQQLKLLLQLATESKRIEKGVIKFDSMKIENEICQYDDRRVSAIEKSFLKFKELVFTLLLKINRC